MRPECRAQNPCQGKHINIFTYTTKEQRNLTTQYATNNEVTELHPVQGSRDGTQAAIGGDVRRRHPQRQGGH
jgi:hypothetical protein